ncbi:MAG: carboxypeptidase-like regulatory domain-containing protein [Planctomycetota bacterium]
MNIAKRERAASAARRGRAALWIVAGVVVLGAVLWLVSAPAGDVAEPGEDLGVARPPVVSVLEGNSGQAPVLKTVETQAEEPEREQSEGPSTVLWPLQVELELVRSSLLPDVPDGPPLGSGRTARFKGRIADHRGLGTAATITFVAGKNAGRVLRTGEDGKFGANDLYPGLEVVEVRGPGISGSRREVRLREGKTFELNLGYGSPGGAQGRVIDEEGVGIEGATVTVDGKSGVTNRTGHFFVDNVAAGHAVLVEIDHPDYAPMRADIGVALAIVAEPRLLTFTLKQPASLRLVLETDIGGPGPATVHLVPRHGGMNRDFPWYRINPIALGTEPVVIEGLPAGSLDVRVYRAGAVGDPLSRRVDLSEGGTETVSLRLRPEPLLTGTVVDDGKIVAGATVRLVAADPVDATLDLFNGSRFAMEEEVVPLSPLIQQETTTSSDGSFRLSAAEDASNWRLIEAIGPDGQRRAVAAVGKNQREIELELEPITFGSAALRLELPRRFQAIAVEATIDGRPGERFDVPSREDLVFDGLATGVWNVRVTWRGQELLDEEGLVLEEAAVRRVDLPEDAILGQDRETWLRAGRPWPLD